MAEFSSIEELATCIKTRLDATTNKKKIVAIYAFNATGKTRLSNLLSGKGDNGEVLDVRDTMDGGIMNDESETMDAPIRTLCYNAFVEDAFIWDNENFILKFDINSWIIKLVIEQGLETEIIKNFKDIVNTDEFKLEPCFNFTTGEVTFKVASGDDDSTTNIKISKGEESIFVWSVFYTVLETAISELIQKKENRSTDVFDDLEYIIIDDPVSSIDDTRIITLAIKLVHLIKNDHISEHLKTTKKELEKQEFTKEYIVNRNLSNISE